MELGRLRIFFAKSGRIACHLVLNEIYVAMKYNSTKHKD